MMNSDDEKKGINVKIIKGILYYHQCTTKYVKPKFKKIIKLKNLTYCNKSNFKDF